MPPSVLARVRKICLSFPAAHEVAAWGEPTFRVRNKMFAMYAAANNHHGAGHHAIWIKSTRINQEFVIRGNPKRYFSPPYVGPSGWIGAILDGRVNWSEVTELLRDGYELTVKPKAKPTTKPSTKPTTKPRTKQKAKLTAKQRTKPTAGTTGSRR
ncbi:MAG TPA: MmcQ/YjbR family DNA-binding protein [Gemmatimonadaceae bacterium]|nr:MmcQ/YjbR family DNA-binding protein [Gemmatimonadaceae bacterium]